MTKLPVLPEQPSWVEADEGISTQGNNQESGNPADDGDSFKVQEIAIHDVLIDRTPRVPTLLATLQGRLLVL